MSETFMAFCTLIGGVVIAFWISSLIWALFEIGAELAIGYLCQD